MGLGWSFMVAQHARLERSIRPTDVLVIGDSHVQGMNVAMLSPFAVNLGIGGDTSLGVLTRLRQHKSRNKVSAVVLAFGLNDLSYRDIKVISDNMRIVLNSIESPVILSAVLPINERYNKPRAGRTNRNIERLNVRLRSRCVERCFFAEIPEQLLSADGNLKFHEGDGVHLSFEGYEIWTGSLKKVLDQEISKASK